MIYGEILLFDSGTGGVLLFSVFQSKEVVFKDT